MTLDTYADLFDGDVTDVGDRISEQIRAVAPKLS